MVSRRRGGTFIAQTAPESSLTAKGQQGNNSIAALTAHLSRRGQHLLGQVSTSPHRWRAFIPGVPDVSAFPHPLFNKVQARISRRPKPERLSYSCSGGTPKLQRALVDYLRVSHGVHCQADQILITKGIHRAIDLVTRMLCDNGSLAWVKGPSYRRIRHVLAMNDVRVEPLTVDANDLCPPGTVDNAPRLIFVTLSHQYPLGAMMNLERHQRLLAPAHQQRNWIVEDDCDSEFRLSGQPILALQGLVPDAPVVCIGTSSKTLYPGLHLGYVVLPRPLVSDLKRAHTGLYRDGHSLIQMALAEFITTGHHSAHIHRMWLLYSRRHAFLTELVQRHYMPYALSDFSDNAGLYLILNLPTEADDMTIAKEASTRHIPVRPLSRYYLTAARKKGLLTGFTSQSEGQMAPAFSVLLGCLQTHCPQMLLPREDTEKQNTPT